MILKHITWVRVFADLIAYFNGDLRTSNLLHEQHECLSRYIRNSTD